MFKKVIEFLKDNNKINMDNKNRYVEQEVVKIIKFWGSFALIGGAFVFILLGILDYFVTPEIFTKFFFYRLIVAFLLVIMFLFYRKIKNAFYLNLLNIFISVLVASTIEIMILSFGGHKSPYYAGLILTVVFILGIIPLSFKMSLLTISVVYSIYIIPILIFDSITDIQTFINNNAFLMTTSTVALAWRFLSQRSLIKKLELEYNLNQQKEELETYSTQLESMVADRTKELTAEKQRYLGLFDNANDGVVVFNKDGIILNVNQKFCELHGFEKNALIGTHIKLLDAGNEEGKKKERMDKIINGEALMFETEHYRRDGSKILLEVSSKAIDIGGKLYIQSFHRDISDKKRLQEQLFQSQKMESVGILAGGIAHDFNNILTAILGHAELLHNYSNLDDASIQKVKTIENSSRKAGQMVAKLLSFARKGSLEILPINLNDVINDTIELIGKMMTNKKIDLRMEMDQNIPAINGDANQLEQVIMNLVMNAGDAMPGGGVITIKTSFADLKDEATHIHPLLSPGKYVLLKITDTGTGIADEIKNKIFDPFFTTKEHGKGTGLGLAMVYGIVKEHKGVINLETQLGKGTTFEVYLPASERLAHKVERPSISSLAGRESILVVDDEVDILSFLKDTLDRQGYKVLVTENPVYALDIFKKIYDEIDLVIVDIVMPLVNGRELIKHFKIIKPKVKVIAISGYDSQKMGRKEEGIDAFIRKPFEGIYLTSTVRRVLDAGVLKNIDWG